EGVRTDRREEGSLPGRAGGGARGERPLRRGGAVGGARRRVGRGGGEAGLPQPSGVVSARPAVAGRGESLTCQPTLSTERKSAIVKSCSRGPCRRAGSPRSSCLEDADAPYHL